MAQAMRGLQHFITDIRNCTTKEQENLRVNKELAHIRSKFTSKGLDGYNYKKYVWKLLYIHMLGFEVDIGHMEAVKLVASTKFSEKTCGYMACSLLLDETHELLRLIIQSIKRDLTPNNEIHQCLALSCIANVGGQEFAESLSNDVQQILLNGKSRSFVKKKAALCLLRLFRKYPEVIPQDNFASKVVSLLDDHNLGVVLSVMALVLGLVSYDTRGFEAAPAKAVDLLEQLVLRPDKKSLYRYYHTICPWLQVKLLRMLQYFPPLEAPLQKRLNDVLGEILTKTVAGPNVNKNNADHSILFEGINLIIHHCVHGKTELHSQAIVQLGRFVSIVQPNFRYLGLETMARLARIPGTLSTIKRHQATIQKSLQDPDSSIRKRALDLLYAMCDKSNAKEIVSQLLKYMQTCSYDLREELVLKIAILAEKFAVDLRWYVDVILQLILVAGDVVSDDIWYRVCQIVTNNEDLQDYAASTCFRFLNSPTVHDNGIKVAAYILGEFGHQIKDKNVTGPKLFDVLRAKFATGERDTKALILTAYIKMANTYPELEEPVNAVFRAHMNNVDCEIQQRACEYYAMSQSKQSDLMNQVFDVMPNFPERESLLLKRLRKLGRHATDRDVWVSAEKKKEESDSDEDTAEKKKKPAKAPPKQTMAKDSEDEESEETEEESDDEQDPFPPQDPKLVTELLTKDKGTLYESPLLQILLQAMIDHASNQAKVIVYYGNRSQLPMQKVSVQLPQQDAFKIQVRPDTKEVDANGAFDVKPAQQLRHFFLWQNTGPWKDLMKIKVNFVWDKKPRSIVLTMPLTLSNFVTPQSLEPAAFITAWQQTSANEVWATRKLPKPLSVAEFKTSLTGPLHLNLIEGVDKNPANVWASGVVNGQSLTVRIETKSNMPVFRVTVHCPSKALGDAFIGSVSAILQTQDA